MDSASECPVWDSQLFKDCSIPPPFHHPSLSESYNTSPTGEKEKEEQPKEVKGGEREREHERKEGEDVKGQAEEKKKEEKKEIEEEEEDRRENEPFQREIENDLCDIEDLRKAVKKKSLDLKEVLRSVLFSSLTGYEAWLDGLEAAVSGNAVLKQQWSEGDTAPNGKKYKREESLAIVLGKSLLLLWECDQDPMVTDNPLLWIISNQLLQYSNQIMMMSTAPFCEFAVVTGVAALLHMGYSPSVADCGGFNGLHYSIQQVRYPLVYLLKRWGAPLDHLSSRPFSVTPLLFSIERRDTKAVDLLLQLGASLEAADDHGVTPLLKTVGFYSKDMHQLLVNRGADKQIQDSEGNSLIHHAAMYGRMSDIDIPLTADNRREGNSLGQTPLHLAVMHRRETTVKYLVDKGAEPEAEDQDGSTPLDYAARMRNRSCFEFLLSRVRESTGHRQVFEMRYTLDEKCLKRGKWKEAIEYVGSLPKIKAQMLFSRDPTKPKDLGYSFPHTSLQRLMVEGSREHRKALVTTVLNKCLHGNKVVRANCLETDYKGFIPGEVYVQSCGRDQAGGKGKEAGRRRKFDNKSDSFLATLCNDEPLFRSSAHHPALTIFMDRKWNRYGFNYFMVSLLVYLFRMLFLTLALGIAARPALVDPAHYDTPLDIFRLVCEAVVLVIIIGMAVMEIVNIIQLRKAYFNPRREFSNIVTWLAISFTLLIVPLRIASLQEQWIIASIAYFFHGVRAFNFAALFRPTGVYVQTLRYIFKEDMLKFLAIFIIVLLLFMGCLGLALRDDLDTIYEMHGPQNATLPEDVTSLFHELYYMGVRTMVEASSVRDYVMYRWLGVVLYLAFLFVVGTVLLNVLIAQMSDTYSRVQSSALTTFLYWRALYMVRVERRQHVWSALRHCRMRTVREESFEELLWSEHRVDFEDGVRGNLMRGKQFLHRLVHSDGSNATEV